MFICVMLWLCFTLGPNINGPIQLVCISDSSSICMFYVLMGLGKTIVVCSYDVCYGCCLR